MSAPTMLLPLARLDVDRPVGGGVIPGPLLRAHPHPLLVPAEPVVLLVPNQRARPSGRDPTRPCRAVHPPARRPRHDGLLRQHHAQAIYLRTPAATVALAEATKDSDLALDPRKLHDTPLIDQAMTAAGFILNPMSNQPGSWQSPAGVPVDLMVPQDLAGPGGRATRGARLPPHDKRAMRRATGLEAAIVDNSLETVPALDPQDERAFDVKVAGPAALVVAKMHKVLERLGQPQRLNDKDAHDIYRILQGVPTNALVQGFRRVLDDPISRGVSRIALVGLKDHLASGPDGVIAAMAGRSEEGIGEPATVSLAVAILAQDPSRRARRLAPPENSPRAAAAGSLPQGLRAQGKFAQPQLCRSSLKEESTLLLPHPLGERCKRGRAPARSTSRLKAIARVRRWTQTRTSQPNCLPPRSCAALIAQKGDVQPVPHSAQIDAPHRDGDPFARESHVKRDAQREAGPPQYQELSVAPHESGNDVVRKNARTCCDDG